MEIFESNISREIRISDTDEAKVEAEHNIWSFKEGDVNSYSDISLRVGTRWHSYVTVTFENLAAFRNFIETLQDVEKEISVAQDEYEVTASLLDIDPE